LSIIVTTYVFLLHVNTVNIYMIIIMSFIITIVVHISIVNVVRTFVHSHPLSLLPIVLPWVSIII